MIAFGMLFMINSNYYSLEETVNKLQRQNERLENEVKENQTSLQQLDHASPVINDRPPIPSSLKISFHVQQQFKRENIPDFPTAVYKFIGIVNNRPAYKVSNSDLILHYRTCFLNEN